MLSHEETMRLLSLAADGDDNATERLIAENTPLLKSIVKRYMGKHIEYDDLFQIAGIGLLKAIKNFKQDFNVRFSTYAVPMILGEIKRQMRDDGYIKVSRSLKSLSSKITRYVDEVIKQGNDDPTVEQIARHFDMAAGVAVRNHKRQGRQTNGTCRSTANRRGPKDGTIAYTKRHVVAAFRA